MRVRGVLCLFALLCVAALPAAATVMQLLYLDDLTVESPVIVHATITNARADWDAGHKLIYTTYTARSENYLKGFLGETFTFRELGGIVGEDGLYVPGVPKFGAGEEVVLFLWTDGPSGTFEVNGLQQGVLRVSEISGVKYVDREIPENTGGSSTMALRVRSAGDRTLSGTLARIASGISRLEAMASQKEKR